MIHGRTVDGASALPTVVDAASAVLAVLLAGAVYVLATSRARARQLTAAATRERDRAAEELRQQAGLLAAVVNTINDGVSVIDEYGRFLVFNPAARRILATEENPDGAEHWQEHFGLFLPNGLTPFPTEQLALVRALAGESSDGMEMIVRNAGVPDGRLLSVDGRPLEPVPGQRAALAVFRDITAQRQHEAELAAFAGVVAHDLKGTLAAISLYGEMAMAAVGKTAGATNVEKAVKALDRLAAAVASMRRLISDLLAYATAREAPIVAEPVDLETMIAEVGAVQADSFSPGVEPNIRVGQLPLVAADRRLLRQLLDNLIGNAMKYVCPGDVPCIDITAHQDHPGWVRIEIADRGIGIPVDQTSRVFEPFYRAHSGLDVGGTGLGLAICRRVVDRHGGLLGVAENPGGGSLFHFTLPLAEPGLQTELFLKVENSIAEQRRLRTATTDADTNADADADADANQTDPSRGGASNPDGPQADRAQAGPATQIDPTQADPTQANSTQAGPNRQPHGMLRA